MLALCGQAGGSQEKCQRPAGRGSGDEDPQRAKAETRDSRLLSATSQFSVQHVTFSEAAAMF